mmetsp:Transcript_17262/g.48586  ORF Transcript_17262/g.48586 Transcript_17262/m.48586 type:complete len:503 (-) Transcript_17262:1544-3052(-)
MCSTWDTGRHPTKAIPISTLALVPSEPTMMLWMSNLPPWLSSQPSRRRPPRLRQFRRPGHRRGSQSTACHQCPRTEFLCTNWRASSRMPRWESRMLVSMTILPRLPYQLGRCHCSRIQAPPHHCQRATNIIINSSSNNNSSSKDLTSTTWACTGTAPTTVSCLHLFLLEEWFHSNSNSLESTKAELCPHRYQGSRLRTVRKPNRPLHRATAFRMTHPSMTAMQQRRPPTEEEPVVLVEVCRQACRAACRHTPTCPCTSTTSTCQPSRKAAWGTSSTRPSLETSPADTATSTWSTRTAPTEARDTTAAVTIKEDLTSRAIQAAREDSRRITTTAAVVEAAISMDAETSMGTTSPTRTSSIINKVGTRRNSSRWDTRMTTSTNVEATRTTWPIRTATNRTNLMAALEEEVSKKMITRERRAVTEAALETARHCSNRSLKANSTNSVTNPSVFKDKARSQTSPPQVVVVVDGLVIKAGAEPTLPGREVKLSRKCILRIHPIREHL